MTLLIAIVGALSGAAGLIISLATRHEELAIAIDGHATMTLADTDHGFYVVRLSVSNGGVRGVIIRDASIWRGDRRLATAVGYLRDFQSVADAYRADAPHPPQRALPLPLPQRQASVLGLVMDPASETGNASVELFDVLNRNNKTMNRPGDNVPESVLLHGFKLRLDLVPHREVSIPLEQLPALPGEQRGSTGRTLDYEIHAPPWRNAVLDLSVGDPAAFSSGRVVLRVWDRLRPRPLVQAERPLDKFITFPVGRRLTSGTYDVGFYISGRLVLSGSFRGPCQRLLGVGASASPPWSRCRHLLFTEPYVRPLGR